MQCSADKYYNKVYLHIAEVDFKHRFYNRGMKLITRAIPQTQDFLYIRTLSKILELVSSIGVRQLQQLWQKCLIETDTLTKIIGLSGN